MNRQIIHILSTNYAGSHFLALQLGAHSKCLSIGELHHYRKETSQVPCFRCEDPEICPVFKGVLHRPVQEFYPALFANVESYAPEVSTLIDNSKKVRWARRFVHDTDYSRKYIHMIRDPRALVRRWIMNNDTPEAKRKMRLRTARRCWLRAPGILTGTEANVYVWAWLHENRQISRFLKRNHLDCRRVTYHDLVFQPDTVLKQLVEWLGYEYEPEMKAYWNFEHHSSIKKDYLKPPADGKKIFDQRWKTFLEKATQVSIFQHPAVNSYISGLGLAYDREGLWRPASILADTTK